MASLRSGHIDAAELSDAFTIAKIDLSEEEIEHRLLGIGGDDMEIHLVGTYCTWRSSVYY